MRLSLAIFSFIKTPLFKGETRQSHFFFPLLDVNTVGESLADVLYSGYGKILYMPGIMRYVAIMVMPPPSPFLGSPSAGDIINVVLTMAEYRKEGLNGSGGCCEKVQTGLESILEADKRWTQRREA